MASSYILHCINNFIDLWIEQGIRIKHKAPDRHNREEIQEKIWTGKDDADRGEIAYGHGGADNASTSEEEQVDDIQSREQT